MSLLSELKARFRPALVRLTDSPDASLELIRRNQDERLGDYQANFAMPLGGKLKRPPREVAAEVVAQVDLAEMCHPPEIAGPGFINLRFRDPWLAARLESALGDPRLGVTPDSHPRTYVIDFSAPNVAKPMHVGHIRSTVIGDALARTLRFLGHRVVTDNHIGDWGTQFGMILYGYRHFRDDQAYRREPVLELARLYRLVRQIADYHEAKTKREAVAHSAAEREAELDRLCKTAGAKPDKPTAKRIDEARSRLADARDTLESFEKKIARVESSPELAACAAQHPGIQEAVLAETARLHAGDPENRRLWNEFLPPCLSALEAMYRRLDVQFDHTLGESFYHDRLGALVDRLVKAGIARESDGAIAVFLDGFDVPMLIRKRDGAFLYATTDLATLEYRVETWQAEAILYVVGAPQALHFDQLFATARRMGYATLELQHVAFGSVLDENKQMYKTRAGDTVGLESLLDEAVARALRVVCENDDAKPAGPELSAERRQEIAEIVGIGAIKYADLSQNRTSDYVFSYDKMVATRGNTATYMQYAYARVRSIFAKGQVDPVALRAARPAIQLTQPAERALGLEILRLADALTMVAADYRPNQLTAYLFELADRFSKFFETCPVLQAETDALRQSRLALCDLTARTIEQGLTLLGIRVVEKM